MAIPKRTEVPEELKWDLTRVFSSDNDWEQEYTLIKKEVQDLSKLKKDFTKDGHYLYDGLTKILEVGRRLEKVYVYATMSSDVDSSDSHYLGYVAQAQTLVSQFEAATSFMNPSILELSQAELKQFMEDEPKLNNYAHMLEQIMQQKPHTLSAQEEKIIADAGDALGTSENTFNVLTNSDMEYGYVETDDGEMVQLSDGLYSNLIQSQNREVRKNAFDVMYATYGQFENSLASTLSGVVKQHNY
ncbi:MAG: oligoendopeptidase F, partial [Lactobacillus apis]|nr:oligoendopeptidase F [Lactobacillus apis]